MFNSIKQITYSKLSIAVFFYLILANIFMPVAAAEKSEPLAVKVQQISVADAKKLYDSGATFVDTRSGLEMYFGVIKNAIAINKKAVSEKAGSLIPNKESTVVTYCARGVRANVAAENFIKLGYKNVYVIHDAGYSDWKKAGFPTVKSK